MSSITNWKGTKGFNKIKFSWADQISYGNDMQFPGYKGDLIDNKFIKLNLYSWMSTRGKSLQEYFYADEDLQLAQNIYDVFGVIKEPFTSEHMFRSYDLPTKQMSNNTISVESNEDLTMNRIQQKQYYQGINYTTTALERYVMPFASKRTFISEESNIACLNINCPFEEIDSWHANLITIFSDSDVPETYTINKNSAECYVISGFDDTQTTSGMILTRGNIYKLETSNSIEVLRTQKDNRILHIWKD